MEKERMFPVRVLVENVRPNHCLTCAHDGQVLVDTFAVLNSQTQLNNVVDTVLSTLGMPQLIQDSRGLIQVNNWKPIPFETITDNQEELAANLFKEISSNITLKILTRHGNVDSHSTQCLGQLKDRILKMALEKQPHFLSMIENHEIKAIVQQMIAGVEVTLNESQIHAINDWMDNLTENSPSDRKSPRTTIRFSVVSEIPTLEQWFNSEPNPSRQTLTKYMNKLNSMPYRKFNPKVTYQQICNWFSQQRAQQRDAIQKADATAITTLAQQLNGFQWPNGTAQHFAAMFNLPATTAAAATTLPTSQSPPPQSTIPIATQPVDIRSKFESNGYNPLLDRQNDVELQRIDGGSESPTGNDDVSEHSASENCGYDAEIKESMISSPELSIDLSAFSPQQRAADSLTSQQNAAAAAAVAALQQLLTDSTSVSLAQLAAQSPLGAITSAQSLSSTTLSRCGDDLDLKPPRMASATAITTTSSQSGQSSAPSSTARSRLMFDPLSELPILEKWFEENPHPGWLQIEQYTDSLNSLQYRQNYPPISTHNVKIWFKNRRAKCKRLLTTDPPTSATGKIPLSA